MSLILSVEIVAPVEFQSALHPLFSNMVTELGILGAVIGGLNARRVTIIDSGSETMKSRLWRR